MSARLDALVSRLTARFGNAIACEQYRGQVTATVPAERLTDICAALRDEADFAFEELIDVCGVDYAAYGAAEWETDGAADVGFSRGVRRAEASDARGGLRFAAVYQLLSVRHNLRLRLKSFAPNDDFPVLPSIVDIWASANWFEREAFDLFGIVFDGHPDLRRILTDYGFAGHPFRKDFPLSGHVEVRYDPATRRVVYEPVSIEPRVLVPRVIREDRAQDEPAAPAKS